MDFSDPKTWTEGAKVVFAAPHIVIPLVLAGAAGAWWFRGTTAKGTIEALQERNNTLEVHRRFAESKADELSRKFGAVTAQLETLEGQIKRGESQQQLLETTTATTTSIVEVKKIASIIGDALTTLLK